MAEVPDVCWRVAEVADVGFLAGVVFDTNEPRLRSRPQWEPTAFHEGLVEDAEDQVAGGVANSTTYVIELGGERVGRLRLVEHPRSLEIAGLQITPSAQNQGVGTVVLRQVQADAAASGRTVTLEVDDDNPEAARLYQRLGFVADGTAKWPNRSAITWTAHS